MSEDEAQALLRRLEEHYRQPVMPLNHFCDAITLWFRCIEENNTDPELSESGYHGRQYYKFLRQMEIDIRKSNLLGRLLYAKEKFRTRKCPVHKGHWDGDAMFFEGCPHKCGGTGWLPERPEDRGYTGVHIYLTREVDGKRQFKNPETGDWEPFPEGEDLDEQS